MPETDRYLISIGQDIALAVVAPERGNLPERVKQLRGTLAQNGITLPIVHIQDSGDIPPTQVCIRRDGQEVWTADYTTQQAGRAAEGIIDQLQALAQSDSA